MTRLEEIRERLEEFNRVAWEKLQWEPIPEYVNLMNDAAHLLSLLDEAKGQVDALKAENERLRKELNEDRTYRDLWEAAEEKYGHQRNANAMLRAENGRLRGLLGEYEDAWLRGKLKALEVRD